MLRIMAVTTESLNARVFPIEQTVSGLSQEVGVLKEELAAAKLQISTRDAELENAERRFEELAKRMDKMERGDRSVHSEKPSAQKPVLLHRRSPPLFQMEVQGARDPVCRGRVISHGS